MKHPLWGDKIETGYQQETLHFWILIATLILIPIMLFPIPLIKHYSHSKPRRSSIRHNEEDVY
jgi:hypothetical protein